MPTTDPFKKCMATALRLLSLRDRSVKELEGLLSNKGHDSKVISCVLDDLITRKFLNDRQFAEKWIRYRLSRGKGERIIRYELQLKGVLKEDIEQAFSVQEDGSATAAAVAIITKKISKFSHLKPFEQQYKLRQILVQKGFSPGVIRAAIDDYLGNRVK